MNTDENKNSETNSVNEQTTEKPKENKYVKPQEDNVLLMVKKNEKHPKVHVVKGADENGNLEVVEPTEANRGHFMHVDKRLNPVENFAANFWASVKDPALHYRFFKAPYESALKVSKLLEKAFQNNKINKLKDLGATEVIKPYYDENRIKWEEANFMGIFQEKLEKDGSLDQMAKGFGSNFLYPIRIPGLHLEAEVRLFLRNSPNGDVFIDKKSKLGEPDFRDLWGLKFDSTDQANLLQSGNMGRIGHVKFPGETETIPVFVSLDSLTERPVTFRASSLNLPDSFCKSPISASEKERLKTGDSIFLRDMEASDGHKFSDWVQVSAETKGVAIVKNRMSKMVRKQEKLINKANLPIKYVGGRALTEEEAAILNSPKGVIAVTEFDNFGVKKDRYYKRNAETGKLESYNANNPNNILMKDQAEKCIKEYREGIATNQQGETPMRQNNTVNHSVSTQNIPEVILPPTSQDQSHGQKR